MELTLGDVEQTALIPVAIKAAETLRTNARIKDDVALSIIRNLNVDLHSYDHFLSHEGVIARTIMLDNMVKNYVSQHKNAVIVNLGAGFDNRFSRIDNGEILWFDVDLPDSIAARRKVFADKERVQMISANVLDAAWVAPVKDALHKTNAPLLVLAEGLFMYLTFPEIQKLLCILTEEFSSGMLYAEMNSPIMVKHEKLHDTVKYTNAVFKSGTNSAQELCQLCEKLTFIEEHSFNEEMKKYSLRGKLFAAFFGRFNDRWATFSW